MALADEIDRLYQVPLAEFTARRNELLKKTAGAEKTRVRALQKPTLPAWAVNQLYWRRRKAFDRVVEAARRRRVEHGRQLSGKAAEIENAEERHREAVKVASEEVRALLKDIGERDTPATMHAVMETLESLSDRNDHGRLAKPLKPQGFEALAGLVGSGGATIARLVERQPAARPAPPPARESPAASAKAEAFRRRKESQARAREIAAADRALHWAEVDERAARTDLSRAEVALARLQRERKDLQERIDAVTTRRDQAVTDLDERRRAAGRATAERERLEQTLKALKSTS